MINGSNKTPHLFGSVALALLLFTTGCVENKNTDSSENPDADTPSSITFKNVTVIPMTSNIELPEHTVIVRDGVIYDIGPSESVTIPDNSIVIDGNNQYLMPGLADMHIHPLCDSESESCYLGSREAEVYLAHGVTTVLSMQDISGTTRNLIKDKLTDPIKDGMLAGPTIYAASFAGGPNDLPGVIHPSQIVVTEQDGRDFVLQSKAQNYDFIKVYDGVSVDAFEGIVAQAEVEGMGVIGHFPQNNPDRTLTDGMNMVAHAGAYLWGYFNFAMNPILIADASAVTASNQVYVNTTLGLERKAVDLACANEVAFNELLNAPQTVYANSVELGIWRGFLQRITNFPGCTPDLMAQRYLFIQQYTKAFYDAGIKLVMGTDSPLVWGVPGYSAHEELQAISALGLSPYETLVIATRNAGEFVDRFLVNAQSFGTIEIGKRADLILVEENPLTDLANAQKQVGVMARGRWFPEAELKIRLKNVADDYAAM